MRKATDYIVIHCSATSASMDIGAREIDRWHRQKGWLKIGYHFVITRDGTVQKGRELNETGAHVEGFNHRSLGICLVGGSQTDDPKTPENEALLAECNFTPPQWAALAVLLEEMQNLFPTARVVGHNELNKHKSCPCFDVRAYMEHQGEHP